MPGQDHRDILVMAIAVADPAAPIAGGLTQVDIAKQEALVTAWLADLDQRVAQRLRSHRTREMYGIAIKPWLAFLTVVARTNAPTPQTIADFVSAAVAGTEVSVSGKPLAPASINSLLAAIASLYRFAERTGQYPDIARTIERQPIRRDGPLAALAHEQILAVKRHLDEAVARADAARTVPGAKPEQAQRSYLVALRNRALLSLLYTTGVRLVSLHRADVRDVDRASNEFHHHPKRHTTKDAVSYLNASTTEALAAYLDTRAQLLGLNPEDPLFISHARGSDGERLTKRSISGTMLGVLEETGHVHRDAAGHIRAPGRLSAHSIRRSAAYRIAERHGLEAARELLGHASAETTRRLYAAVKQADTLRKAANDLE